MREHERLYEVLCAAYRLSSEPDGDYSPLATWEATSPAARLSVEPRLPGRGPYSEGAPHFGLWYIYLFCCRSMAELEACLWPVAHAETDLTDWIRSEQAALTEYAAIWDAASPVLRDWYGDLLLWTTRGGFGSVGDNLRVHAAACTGPGGSGPEAWATGEAVGAMEEAMLQHLGAECEALRVGQGRELAGRVIGFRDGCDGYLSAYRAVSETPRTEEGLAGLVRSIENLAFAGHLFAAWGVRLCGARL